MKRFLDLMLCVTALSVFAVPIAVIALAVKLTSPGPAVYWSRRVGRHNQIFWMPKFRTMRTDTPQLATHLLRNADRWMTPIGPFLRSTSLDELPQLWSVLVGDMTLVGPRPALFNQDDLVSMRTARGIHELVPGVTGWAQINGRDELSLAEKVAFESYYLTNQNLWFDLQILWGAAFKVARRENVVQAGS